MEDYWSEVKNIEEDGQRGHEDLLERGSMDGRLHTYQEMVLLAIYSSSWAQFQVNSIKLRKYGMDPNS